jgi:hypothetical protein
VQYLVWPSVSGFHTFAALTESIILMQTEAAGGDRRIVDTDDQTLWPKLSILGDAVISPKEKTA